MASSATRVWSCGDRSNVDAATSPCTDRRMSVTSSGRSPTRTTIRWHSGLFSVTAWAICLSTVVLPALGGDTMSARCPLPIGMTRSMTRVVSRSGVVDRCSRSCGYSGVSAKKSGRCRASSAGLPFTVSTRTTGACAVPLDCVAPVTSSPRRSPYRRRVLPLRYASSRPGAYPPTRRYPWLSVMSTMPVTVVNGASGSGWAGAVRPRRPPVRRRSSTGVLGMNCSSWDGRQRRGGTCARARLAKRPVNNERC